MGIFDFLRKQQPPPPQQPPTPPFAQLPLAQQLMPSPPQQPPTQQLTPSPPQQPFTQPLVIVIPPTPPSPPPPSPPDTVSRTFLQWFAVLVFIIGVAAAAGAMQERVTQIREEHERTPHGSTQRAHALSDDIKKLETDTVALTNKIKQLEKKAGPGRKSPQVLKAEAKLAALKHELQDKELELELERRQSELAKLHGENRNLTRSLAQLLLRRLDTNAQHPPDEEEKAPTSTELEAPSKIEPPAAPKHEALAKETPPATPAHEALAKETPPATPAHEALAKETPPAAPEHEALAKETPPATPAPKHEALAKETPPATPAPRVEEPSEMQPPVTAP